jgi:integrase/recombinase XerD
MDHCALGCFVGAHRHPLTAPAPARAWEQRAGGAAPAEARVEIAELPFHDLSPGTARSEVAQSPETGSAAGRGLEETETDAFIVQGWLSSFDPRASARTLSLYRRVAGGFMCWLDQHSLTLGSLTPSDFARYRDQLQGADSTRANRLAVAKSLLSYAHTAGHIRANVGRAVRGPRLAVDPDARALSESDVARLIRTAEAVLHAERARPTPRPRFLRAYVTKLYLVRFLYVSGARVSEVVSIRWGDLRLRADGDIHLSLIGKGRKRRTLPLPLRFVEDLRRHYGLGALAPAERIFPFGARRAQTIIAELAGLSGLEPGVSAHWLRHACATHALARGAPLHVVQRTLGHVSLATTGRYAHALADGAAKYLPAL